MKRTSENISAFIDETISQRTGFGPNEMVRGWQAMLKAMLSQFGPYLQSARIATFREITASEQDLFQLIIRKVQVPQSTCGVFLSPSARNQMMYTNRGQEIPDSARHPADDGVLLFSRCGSYRTIVNVLLAHPPHTPAIDVYHDGALLAGYVYETIDGCMDAVSDVLATHLSHDDDSGQTSPENSRA